MIDEEIKKFIIEEIEKYNNINENSRMNSEIDHSMKLRKMILSEYEPLKQRMLQSLNEVKVQLSAQSVGLKNVYDEFKEVKDFFDSVKKGEGIEQGKLKTLKVLIKQHKEFLESYQVINIIRKINDFKRSVESIVDLAADLKYRNDENDY